MRILIVEDQPELAATIGDFLELNQHQTDFAGTGESALALVHDNEYDAILLDINLPRKDGLDVCRELRAGGSTVPVLMLTARDTLAILLRVSTGAPTTTWSSRSRWRKCWCGCRR